MSLEILFATVLELKANNEKFRVLPASHCCRKLWIIVVYDGSASSLLLLDR